MKIETSNRDTKTKDNVVLLPQTVDYYQFALTEMLETERYGEAIRLLRFLKTCQGYDARTMEEWLSLLKWLENEFPLEAQEADRVSETEQSEAELLKEHLRKRAEKDSDYVKRLLDTVLSDSSSTKKMVAVEQLVHLEHPLIDDTLRRWLETVEHHPIVQMSLLQALRQRGASGDIEFSRLGEKIRLRIEDTPQTIDHFPQPILQILEQIQDVSETHYPALFFFAEKAWSQFIYIIYGTSVYQKLIHGEPSHLNIWSAALHTVVAESMLGGASAKEIRAHYDIDGDQTETVEAYCRTIRQMLGSDIR